MSGPFGSSPWGYNPGGGFYSNSIDQSLRFDDGDTPALSKLYGAAQTNTKKLTISVWVKRGNLGLRSTILYAKSGGAGKLSFQTTDKIYFNAFNTGYNGFESNALFRDTSAWYHIVAQADSDGQTGANVNRVYVNGVELSNNKTSSFVPDDTATMLLRNGVTTYVGDDTDGTYHFDGYLAELNVIDGSVVAPTEFAETKDNIWIPKAYSGSYGDNGFRLTFQGTGTATTTAGNTAQTNIGDDQSGNGNNFAVTNLVADDVVPDSPTNNFAVGNPLSSYSNNTFTEGNLKITGSGVNYYSFLSSMGMETDGKYYFEVYSNARYGSYAAIGICKPSSFTHTMSVYNTAGIMAYVQGQYVKYLNNTVGSTANLYDNNPHLFSFAIDLDNNIFHFRTDGGSWENSGDPAGGTGGFAIAAAMQGETLMPFFGPNGAKVQILNFGQDSSFAGTKTTGSASAADGNGVGDFYYAPPSGFLALCSANLPEPDIIDSTEYFNTLLWSGDASQTRSFTGLGFQPDFSWLKIRSGTTQDHQLYDSVRGAGGGKSLSSNTTAIEGTVNTVSDGDYGFVSSFDADGFSVDDGAIATTGGYVNHSGRTYVAWNWLAGTAFSNDAGANGATIASSGQVNTTAGFSIVKHDNGSGARTVAHGLSSAPEIIFEKKIDAVGDWIVQYTVVDGTSDYMRLNTLAAKTDGANALPTPTVYTPYVGGGADCLAYCFHSVEGYSKVSHYTGNNTFNFVYTGFRPAFLLLKKTALSQTYGWQIYDTKRSPINVTLLPGFWADQTVQEAANTYLVNIHSNGFELTGSGANQNASGVKYLYIAFAEQPFKYANAR